MAGEATLSEKLKRWAYDTYGEADPRKQTGLIKIVKMTTLAQYGEAGQPDWAVWIKGAAKTGRHFLLELKNPDGTGEVSEIQRYRHEQYRYLGFKVYVVDNLTLGKQIIRDEVTRARGRPGSSPKASPTRW